MSEKAIPFKPWELRRNYGSIDMDDLDWFVEQTMDSYAATRGVSQVETERNFDAESESLRNA